MNIVSAVFHVPNLEASPPLKINNSLSLNGDAKNNATMNNIKNTELRISGLLFLFMQEIIAIIIRKPISKLIHPPLEYVMLIQ
ncbi:MAG: hypothetical protein PHS93_04215 [Candidatus Omnitrophica bacterium]|nr:hypothetical protein [Candidatus Omnitrophota bacterium]MDD5352354.1 hypothetical protein [Candidatus Omnitrophota bacterium]MDD5549952.1 hypothetical protein [Candidatus Omnitrophota bacterium]